MRDVVVVLIVVAVVDVSDVVVVLIVVVVVVVLEVCVVVMHSGPAHSLQLSAAAKPPSHLSHAVHAAFGVPPFQHPSAHRFGKFPIRMGSSCSVVHFVNHVSLMVLSRSAASFFIHCTLSAFS